MAIDERIVKLGILIGDKLRWYEDLNIIATGELFVTPVLGVLELTITNLARDVRELLQRECAPQIKSDIRKSVILEVGRKSYGTSTLISADIFRVSVGQKPDMDLNFSCIPNFFYKNKSVSISHPASTLLSTIAQSVANANGLALSFEIADRQVKSCSYSGTADGYVKLLASLTGSDVYVSGGLLVVKDKSKSKRGTSVVRINKTNGMVGVPQSVEYGVKVTTLYNPTLRVGGRIEIESEICPQLNGQYIVIRLLFDITNRGDPFYLTAEARFAEDRI